TSPTIRSTSALVLPVPAAASTKKLVPNSEKIRRRASLSDGSVMAMLVSPEAVQGGLRPSARGGALRVARRPFDNRRHHIAQSPARRAERAEQGRRQPFRQPGKSYHAIARRAEQPAR